MKSKSFFLCVLLLKMTIVQGQITLSPHVGSQKSKLITISSVATNALFTTVVIDFQQFVLQSSNNSIWIGPNTYIEYYSTQTGRVEKLRAISLDRMINSEDKFVNSDFVTNSSDPSVNHNRCNNKYSRKENIALLFVWFKVMPPIRQPGH